MTALVNGQNYSPVARHLAKVQPATLVFIDANNLRGNALFSISPQALCHKTQQWAQRNEIPAVLVFHHGATQRAWPLGPYAVATLSGPTQSADDSIVRDAYWTLQAPEHSTAATALRRAVAVFTSDAGLTGRVRRLSTAGTIQVIKSSSLVEEFCELPCVAGNRGESTAQRCQAALELAAELDTRALQAHIAVDPFLVS